MLTKLDDLLVHQIPSTFDHVGPSDVSFTEKMWFTIEDIESGDTIIDCGIGQYPNRNVQDAFAGVTIGDKQYNVRMSRELRPHADEMRVGPFSIEIVEGLKTLRLVLEDNPSGLSFDITWDATMKPHEEAHHYERLNGKVTHDLDRYAQMGRATGTLRVAGRTIDIRPATWWCQRDHSWGIRPGVGGDAPKGPEMIVQPRFFNWCPAQFQNYGIFWFLIERGPGDPSYLSAEIVKPIDSSEPGQRIVAIDHDFCWKPAGPVQSLEWGEVDFVLASGEKRHVTILPRSSRYFLRSGLYGGLNGWWHGAWKGPHHFEHDVWDLSDEAVLRAAGTFGDQIAEFRCGADVGYGIIEYGVSGGYPKYQDVQ